MGFVTITKAKLAPDLSTCVIYWSVIGTEGDKSKTLHALEHARLFIQRRVAEGLRTRSAPILAFEFDPSVEGSIKMGGLLKSLREERGEPSPSAAEADPDVGEEEGEDEDESEEAEEDDAADEDEGDGEGEDEDTDEDAGEGEGDESGDSPPDRASP